MPTIWRTPHGDSLINRGYMRFLSRKVKTGVFCLLLAVLSTGLLVSSTTPSQSERLTCVFTSKGGLRDIFKKHQYAGTVSVKEVLHKKNKYGLGPRHLLNGEVTIYDGKSYTAVAAGAGVEVTESAEDESAIFMAYGRSKDWQKFTTKDDLYGMANIEYFIEDLAKRYTMDTNILFMFRIEGMAEDLRYSVVSRKPGDTDTYSASAHKRARVPYDAELVEANFIGAWSNLANSGRYTDRDTRLHVHMISADKKISGHVEDLTLKAGSVIYLPRCH